MSAPWSSQRLDDGVHQALAVVVGAGEDGRVAVAVTHDGLGEDRALEDVGRRGPEVQAVVVVVGEGQRRVGRRALQHASRGHRVDEGQRHAGRGRADDGVDAVGDVGLRRLGGDGRVAGLVTRRERHVVAEHTAVLVDLVDGHLDRLRSAGGRGRRAGRTRAGCTRGSGRRRTRPRRPRRRRAHSSSASSVVVVGVDRVLGVVGARRRRRRRHRSHTPRRRAPTRSPPPCGATTWIASSRPLPSGSSASASLAISRRVSESLVTVRAHGSPRARYYGGRRKATVSRGT
jgi:hypothetical protein